MGWWLFTGDVAVDLLVVCCVLLVFLWVVVVFRYDDGEGEEGLHLVVRLEMGCLL